MLPLPGSPRTCLVNSFGFSPRETGSTTKGVEGARLSLTSWVGASDPSYILPTFKHVVNQLVVKIPYVAFVKTPQSLSYRSGRHQSHHLIWSRERGHLLKAIHSVRCVTEIKTQFPRQHSSALYQPFIWARVISSKRRTSSHMQCAWRTLRKLRRN